ncbi:MAG: translation initiation factor 2 subunit 1 [Thermoproteota archaeon]|nr:translation initiation factor 2 subunit 1 [Thermoproteota archaeon]
MEESKQAVPEIGELVIGTVLRIATYGAYITLDEYNNIEGLLHISEISSSWVKSIRDHVREGQKTVLKVLRVESDKLHVDLSLRRVNEREKREKLLEWKRDRRGRKLLDMAAEKMKVNPDDAYQTIGVLLEDHFGSIYAGFEKAAEGGTLLLNKANVPSDWSLVLAELAKSKVKVPRMKARGTLELSCPKPNGVLILKDAFKKAVSIKKPENADVKIYVIGAPRYRIEVLAGNYKEVEKILEGATQIAIKTVEAGGGEGKFKR